MEETIQKEYTNLSLTPNQKKYASVKYANQFNSASLGNLSSTELNILHAFIVELKKYASNIADNNQIIPPVIRVAITFNEIYNLCALDSRHDSEKELFNVIKQFAKKAMSATPILELKETTEVVKWTYFFQAMVFDPTERIFYIEMNRTIFSELLLVSNEYTQFEFTEFLSIKSKYAKLLYRLLKQYKTTGVMVISLEDLKQRLEIPISYNWSSIKNQILGKCIKELQKPFDIIDIACSRTPFSNLKFDPIFSSGFTGNRGRSKVKGLKFTFDKVKQKTMVQHNQ